MWLLVEVFEFCSEVVEKFGDGNVECVLVIYGLKNR